ncbi:hypothetical protein [Streptomyces sp. AK02-01A]|uniref:hypothetical protein n=1 Tax=Streptomyces sp. AK02-01A TaxID=3028648 RepID=UPI0029A7ACD6|nr:hypothetical protein [Streptomyces sp. AK02-01A]MDX3849069.1 GntR family transcriptional regulator [Streptomyces sp. AK02-01A]
MAESNFNAPTSGVIHIRTRHTENFTVLSNRLVQRPGSAVTVGVAAYILSLPDGAPIRVSTLCEHFAEGRDRISRALNELEEEGWLERRVERGPGGRIVTRTLLYDAPGAEPDPPHAPSELTAPTPPEPVAQAPAAATGVLASLRERDARLALTRRDLTRLGPMVADWLSQGSSPQDIARALTEDLPSGRLRSAPGLLAYRLTNLPPPAPTAVTVPLQECPKCDRPFRAERPGKCRDCRAPAAVRQAA